MVGILTLNLKEKNPCGGNVDFDFEKNPCGVDFDFEFEKNPCGGDFDFKFEGKIPVVEILTLSWSLKKSLWWGF